MHRVHTSTANYHSIRINYWFLKCNARAIVIFYVIYRGRVFCWSFELLEWCVDCVKCSTFCASNLNHGNTRTHTERGKRRTKNKAYSFILDWWSDVHRLAGSFCCLVYNPHNELKCFTQRKIRCRLSFVQSAMCMTSEWANDRVWVQHTTHIGGWSKFSSAFSTNSNVRRCMRVLSIHSAQERHWSYLYWFLFSDVPLVQFTFSWKSICAEIVATTTLLLLKNKNRGSKTKCTYTATASANVRLLFFSSCVTLEFLILPHYPPFIRVHCNNSFG